MTTVGNEHHISVISAYAQLTIVSFLSVCVCYSQSQRQNDYLLCIDACFEGDNKFLKFTRIDHKAKKLIYSIQCTSRSRDEHEATPT